MYLVEDRQNGSTHLVFTWKDPRRDGYVGDVTKGVTLDYDEEEIHNWPDGEDSPDVCVGRSNENPNHFKVFKYKKDRQIAGFQPISGLFDVLFSWSDYLKLRRPEDLGLEDWFDQLDRYDAAARRRRDRAPEPDLPKDANRDEVAAWVAKQHMLVDANVREIWYLPGQAPPEEIRLLEVNDILAGPEGALVPLEYGLDDVADTRFRLLVGDLTGEKLERIQRDPARLPRGWSFEGSRVWRRRK